MGSATPPRPARLLVASAEEWFSRSLETLLRPAQFTVARAYTGQAALDAVRDAPPPDAILLDLELPDPDGLTVCRAVRAGHFVSASTPIILTTSGPATRPLRLEALRAGAGELRSGPLDPEEFVLDIEARLAAKFDADRARDEGLTDQASGAYNTRGLERRAREVAAAAVRHRTVFGCAAIVPENGGSAELGDRLGKTLQGLARSSDVVARVGPAEFVVLAPETDAAGVAGLAGRLARTVGAAGVRIRTAHAALPAPPDATADPLLPIRRARVTLGTVAPS